MDKKDDNWKLGGPRIAKTILGEKKRERENKVGGLKLPDLKTYYKATVIKYGTGIGEINRPMEEDWKSKTNLLSDGHWFSTRAPRPCNGERIVSSSNAAGQLDIHVKRMEVDPYLTPYKNVNSLGVKDLNESTEILKLSGKNQIFVIWHRKHKATNEKINWTASKVKILVPQKTPSKWRDNLKKLRIVW